MQESQVLSLGLADSLEKEMAIDILVFLPGESHGQKSLGSYSPWVCKESNMTKHTCTGETGKMQTPEF